MQIRKHISLVFTLVGYFVLVLACANPTGPSGGERDTKGPEIIGVIPEPGTLNFNYNEVEFYFDEFLKPGNYPGGDRHGPFLKCGSETYRNPKAPVLKYLIFPDLYCGL